MDFAANNPMNYSVAQTIMLSPLWKYWRRGVCGDFRCPAVDRSTTLVNGVATPRVRSISMNCYVGGPSPDAETGASTSLAYRLYAKMTSITRPAQIMLLLDEREDSINNGYFGINMKGYSPNSPSAYQFFDFPAFYHNRAAGIAFADGHSEMHRWVDARTMKPIGRTSIVVLPGTASPNNADIFWIQDHATQPK